MTKAVASPSRLTRPGLTIRFMGLCALVQDRLPREAATRVTVVLPQADEMKLGLCVHRPFLCFRHDDLAGVSGKPDHFSFADSAAASSGLWDLQDLELSIDEDDPRAAPSLRLEPDYERLLAFDDLTPGLGSFDPKYLKPEHWRNRVAAAMHLGTGTLSSEPVAGHEDSFYDVGPRGSFDVRPVSFRQVAVFRYLGQPDQPVISVSGRRSSGGAKDTLRFRAGAELTITHLCAVGEDDGDRLYEADVLAFYELSSLNVALENRSVLHPVQLSTVGLGTRPTTDACPPARAYLAG